MQRAQAGYRVDTGPLKIDDDWPGYFIRGDNAAGVVASLMAIADHVPDPMSHYLRDLAKDISQCHVDSDRQG